MTPTESFRDKPLLWGVAISLLWHFLWFFSVTITVSPSRMPFKPRPKAVSLGPVLDDEIFRTLVAAKPLLSETFYRRLSDFSEAAPLEPPVKTIERRMVPGDVVSVPFGRRLMNSLRELVGGEKVLPEYEFLTSRLRIGYSEQVARLEGEIKNREVLSRPKEPRFPEGVDPTFRDSETEIEFAVDSYGEVVGARVVGSSGSPVIDSLWLRYLRRWQFAPHNLPRASSRLKGNIKFRFSP